MSQKEMALEESVKDGSRLDDLYDWRLMGGWLYVSRKQLACFKLFLSALADDYDLVRDASKTLLDHLEARTKLLGGFAYEFI
jgi:hypothetical protein